jgi:hypothetical protein
MAEGGTMGNALSPMPMNISLGIFCRPSFWVVETALRADGLGEKAGLEEGASS